MGNAPSTIDTCKAPQFSITSLILALILFFRSVRQGGYRIFHKETNRDDRVQYQGAATRVLLTLFISLVYAIGFLFGKKEMSDRVVVGVFYGISVFTWQR